MTTDSESARGISSREAEMMESRIRAEFRSEITIAKYELESAIRDAETKALFVAALVFQVAVIVGLLIYALLR